MRNLDVLFCTALDEESYVLEAWMREDARVIEEPYDFLVVEKKVGQAQLLIGLQVFGEMGNVSSAINLSRALPVNSSRDAFSHGCDGWLS